MSEIIIEDIERTEDETLEMFRELTNGKEEGE